MRLLIQFSEQMPKDNRPFHTTKPSTSQCKHAILIYILFGVVYTIYVDVINIIIVYRFEPSKLLFYKQV